MFGHLPEILLICLVGLLILGPKRMIEMGSALGRAVRELREATKDLNWGALLDSGEPGSSRPTSGTLGAISQFTQSLTHSLKEISGPAASSPDVPPSTAAPPTSQTVIEGSMVERQSIDPTEGAEDQA